MTTKHFSSGQALDRAASVSKKPQWRALMAQGQGERLGHVKIVPDWLVLR